MKYFARFFALVCLFCAFVALTGWGFLASQKESRVESSGQEMLPAVAVSVLVTKVDASSNSAQVTWWAEIESTGSLSQGNDQVVLEAPQLSDTEILFRPDKSPC